MGFSSLLYTECRPDRSVHGREGMQFQAESPGATAEMEQAIVAHLLHRPSQKLMAADTPVDAHPLSFSYYRARGHYYLGVGRYIGRDSRGREGNQLTHCLVTDDPDDIRPARPAQLFRSGVWLTVPSDSIRLETVAAPLRVADAYQPTALHTMACAQPGIENFLPKLLTAFEEAVGAQRKKLVVSATDVDQAIRWIALGGLFLNPADVLDMSFRVFTESPLADDLSIAVFNPALIRSAPAIEALPAALNGIDLDSYRTSAITPSESAATYARWFLEHDAFDALEAIELGRRWQPHLASPAVATAMTGIVCLDLPAGRETDAGAIAEALAAISEHEPDDMDEYGGVLAEALLTIRPSATDDPAAVHRAVLALRRNRHHDAAESLTLALLEGTRLYPDTYGVRWSEAIRTPDTGEPARARWSSAETQHRAVQLLSETLAAAQDSSLGPLFTIIPVLGLGIRWVSVQAAGERLADYWAVHPEAVSGGARTAFYPELEALLWQALESRILDRDETVRRAMMSGRWDWLRAHTGRYGSSSAVAVALTASAVASAPHPERLVILREYLDTATAPHWSLFFEAGRPVDPDLLGVWVSADPAALHDRPFADLVAVAIDRELSGGARTLLDRLARLHNLPPELADISAKALRAQEILKALRDGYSDIPNPLIDDLATIDVRFQNYYAANIAEYLILQSDQVGVSRYLSATRSYQVRQYFYGHTIAHLQNDMPGFAHQLLYVCRSKDTAAPMRNEVEGAFADWIRKSGNKKRALEAGRHLDRHHQVMWNALIEDVSAERVAHRPQPRKLPSIPKFRKGSR
ncbi:hypothetical protein GFY24_30260 [Nocardia sp. SYP-A9097]|uniref:GAP1-N2 domain-containing protein n=1 Tax=Nocardia sp. SYP-A9097 TaxID=2663237 RepID=UPI00129A5E10|nr:hypothetical protein [Nocardia sp. SYP-A9097]MRH91674.1 hypothetical protein [Nocardia sp. SYP-A9097]